MPLPERPPIEEITGDRVVFVEGRFDSELLRGLCSQRRLVPPQVIPLAGKTPGKGIYERYLNQARFQNASVRGVGFIRDSDFAQPDSAFSSLCGLFTSLGWPPPADVDQFITTPLGCKAAIHIVPARGQPGCLETLCMRAVAEDPASKCVEEFLECLNGQGIQHEGGQREKAKMQAFVASRPKPQTPLRVLFGETTTWRYDSREYDPLASFLSKLSQV
jgi:hypothetical protein